MKNSQSKYWTARICAAVALIIVASYIGVTAHRWCSYWAKPIPAFERIVEMWMPSGGILLNREGKVISEREMPSYHTAKTFEFPIDHFKRMKFEGMDAYALILSDGTIHYRSGPPGFTFIAEDNLENYFPDRKGFHGAIRMAGIRMEKGRAIVSYEKSDIFARTVFGGIILLSAALLFLLFWIWKAAEYILKIKFCRADSDAVIPVVS